jgi:predicted exporter
MIEAKIGRLSHRLTLQFYCRWELPGRVSQPEARPLSEHQHIWRWLVTLATVRYHLARLVLLALVTASLIAASPVFAEVCSPVCPTGG